MPTGGKPIWHKTKFSPGLSGRKNRDTAPELLLRRELFRRGLRFRLNRKVSVRNKADIVFPRAMLAIYVDGCFWHGCPKHGRNVFRGANAGEWIAKMQRNRERDQRGTEQAESEGWNVMRIWECDIKSDIDRIANEIWNRVYAKKRS